MKRKRRKMRETTIRTFLIPIVLCIALAAAALFGYNVWEMNRDADSAGRALSVLKPEIKKYAKLRETAFVIGAPEIEGMPAIRIDGVEYIGELRIPELNLDLPVRAVIDYAKLKESPCRYSGSYMNNDLVLSAHDYSKWFGKVSTLKNGEELFFTNANGEVYRYVIASEKTAVEAEIGSLTREAAASGLDWDLALMTCNMGGQVNYVAWCTREEDD